MPSRTKKQIEKDFREVLTVGKLVNFLEDLKDEYKERRDEENIWDELHRLREAVEMESKAIKVMAKYLDRKEKERKKFA